MKRRNEDKTTASVKGRAVLSAMAKAKKRRPDVIDVRPAVTPPRDVVAPTPEQMRRADFVLADVHDRTASGRSIKLGKAYQRRPRFESIEGLTVPEIKALRFYRLAYDRSAMSETKSGLDIGPGGSSGGSDSAIARVAAMAFANHEVKRMEDRLPNGVIATMRAVALHDYDFTAVAIARFGGRDVEIIDVTGARPMTRKSVQPRSGRHRAIIRDEFMAGASALVSIVAPMSSASPSAIASAIEGGPAIDVPPVDPAFLDEQGRMRPSADIADIVRERAANSLASRTQPLCP